MKKHIIIIFILTIIALWPFFRKGFFESHDGEWMVIRFTAFHQTLSSGQFPVRFVDRLNNNYGYPVLNFLYPLPFYLAEIPKILGLGFIDSIKVAFVIPTIISVVAMYLALAQIFEKRAALTGAVLYLFTPYRFVDLYTRGSLGENLAFTFVPLVAYSLFKISQGKNIYLPLLSLSIFLLTISHNVIAALFLPFFYISIYFLKKKYWLKINFSFLIGVVSSSFFSIPALYDLKFVRLSQIKVSNISDHLVNIWQLIIPSWGFGPNPNSAGGISTQIGLVVILVVLAATYLLFFKKAKNTFAVYQILVILGAVFLMTKQSLFIWNNVPYIGIIQFPWRLLSLIVFMGAFLSAFVVNFFPRKNIVAFIIIALAIVSTWPYIKPQKFTQKEEGFYSTNEDTTTVSGEYTPLWVKEQKNQRADQKIEINGIGKIENQIIKPTKYKATIDLKEKSQIIINTIYFPGWKVMSNGKNIPINYKNKYGLITFELPEGKSAVIIKYGKSQLHLIAEIISLVGLLSIGVYFLILWQKQNS